RYFSVIDGIIGGEGEGPLHPDAYPSGVILAGFNPVAVDWVATRLMGFNPDSIALYANALEQMREFVSDFAIDKIGLQSNITEWQQILTEEESVFQFRAAAGWQGKIEQQKSPEACERTVPGTKESLPDHSSL